MDSSNNIDDTSGPFGNVLVEITVSVGKAKTTVQDLLNLENESVLQMNRRISDPVELYIADKLIARGELQEQEGEDAGKLAVRLTEINEQHSEF